MSDEYKRTFRLNRRSARDARTSVDEELDFHLSEVVDQLVEDGWAEPEALEEARRRFGDIEDARSYCADVQTRKGREEKTIMWLDEVWQDIRYAARTLRGVPGYSALVVFTLAFGIAANTTIFSVMNPFLFRPLPYGDATELVQVNQVNPITGWDMDRFSYPQYEDWRERTRAFQDVAAYSYGSANLTGPEGPEKLQYANVTANMFEVLDAQPMMGRSFRPEEGRPGGEPVVMLGEGFWARRYASDPAILGRPVTLDGNQYTVVGIMPARFNFPFGSARLWLPIRQDASADRSRLPYQLIGRLNPGWDAERARDDLVGIQRQLADEYPETDARMDGVTVKPLREALNFAWDILSISFTVLLGAVGFVLLIACVNVAGLTLARGSVRTREVALRASLGARRGRIVRQLLTESLMLALAGGALGVFLAYLATRAIGPVLPEDLYRIGDIAVDRVALAFTGAVTLLTVVAFGLMPALSAARVDLSENLKEGSRGSGGAARSRARKGLVVAQVALAVVLITGAALMLRSLAGVQQLDLGFDAERLVVVEAGLSSRDYPSVPERLAFVDRAVEEMERVPGITSASASAWLPLNHETSALQVAPPDMAGTPSEEWPLAVVNQVHPGYFSTMGIELIAGRDFGRMDDTDAPPVVVVNRILADRFWPNGDAVGQTVLGVYGTSEPTAYTVVGVVGAVRHTDLSAPDVGPQIYQPTLQSARLRYFVIGRADRSPSSVVAGAREAMRTVDSDLPVNVRTMTSVVRENELQWSLSGGFLTIFGLGALALATLGIYGLIAFSVSQRRREIGVRIALGATRAEIRSSVVKDGLRLTVIGLVIGLTAAVAFANGLAGLLYDITPFDPATLVVVPLLFVLVASAATLLPANRASRTDPISVLRSE